MSSVLLLEMKARVLGVIFNTHFIFYPHIVIDSIITRASSRINILKALACINLGSAKGKYPNFLQIPNPIHFYQCRSQPVPQHSIINDPETSNTPKFRRNHRLRYDDFH